MKVNGVEPGLAAGMENFRSKVAGKDRHSTERANGPADNDAKEQVGGNYSREQLQNAVAQMNETMQTYNTKIHFELHEKSGEYIVKVIKDTDNTVIREIPPKKVLDMVAYFKEMLGIIVDKII